MLPDREHAEALMRGVQVVEMQDDVTLLYSDIRGFTNMSGHKQPRELCELLNDLYSAFDEHIDERQVYKIDTIGDAFVVAGGLRFAACTRAHAAAVCDFALDMLLVGLPRYQPFESIADMITLSIPGVLKVTPI